MLTLETPNSGTVVNLPPMASGGDTSTREKAKDAQTYDVEDSESEPEPDKESPDGATKAESPMVTYLEQMFCKRLDAMQSMVERLPGVAPPIRKSNPDAYASTPFTDEITLIEMARKFSFPSMKAYDRYQRSRRSCRPVQTKDARCSTPKGVAQSYHMQRIRLNPDLTRLAMVYQPTLQVHSVLHYPQRHVRGTIHQQQRPAKTWRKPLMVYMKSSSIERNPCEAT